MEALVVTAALTALLSNHPSYGNIPKSKTRQPYDFSGPWFDRPLNDENDWWEKTLNTDNWTARSHDLDPSTWEPTRAQHLNRVHDRAYVSTAYFF